nr:fumarate hydratase C-terminal domain-containing protein [Ralstonia solanacearum]
MQRAKPAGARRDRGQHFTAAGRLGALHLTERGALRELSGQGIVANVRPGVARRELEVLAARVPGVVGPLPELSPAEGPGNALVLVAVHEHVTDVFTGFDLMAVGGAAYLVSKAIRGAKVLAFEDLGMEAIYEFDVKDMPVTVAVDSSGTSVHKTGPAEWQAKIGKIPVAAA